MNALMKTLGDVAFGVFGFYLLGALLESAIVFVRRRRRDRLRDATRGSEVTRHPRGTLPPRRTYRGHGGTTHRPGD